MRKMIKTLWIVIVCQFLLIPGVCLGDEVAIFSISVDPDALILLDLSGSMDDDPTGNSCYTASCSKLAMAKNAIKAILDDNGDGVINSSDETSLAIRIGYMRFYNCQSDDTGGSYNNGCNILRNAIPNTDPPPFSSPSRYSDVWSNVNAESANGGTPLASALGEAKLYLDAHKALDSAKACRLKYVILVTDGQDTYSCTGDGTETQSGMYKRRKATVAKAKALSDAGYKVYVIGFGANMPAELMNTLNWTAYYGGTNNPSATQSGNSGAITPSTNPCGEGSTNDPGQASLSGYAFMATSASEIANAIKAAFDLISQSRISFSLASVSASRVQSENFLYAASFQPVSNDPFWPGNLGKYNINADGSIGSMVWNAGDALKAKQSSNRNILTYLGGSMTSLSSLSASSLKGYLGVSTNSLASAITGYIQGNPANNPDNWKLGDTIHSNPISIGSPSNYFADALSPGAFSTFRVNNQDREDIIVMGSNDGQLRAFSGSNGDEKWSFIPPNLLPKLQYIAHFSHPISPPMSHQYFVDGPVIAADVWLGTGDGTSKSSSSWKTVMVFSEGKGVRNSTNTQASYLWSSSQYCDGSFNYKYTSTYKYYCGYWAFDVTNTSATTPALMWRINPDSTTGPYLDEPWSKMAIGRVKINGNEEWVGFIGAGYNNDGDPNRGKGFFVVDLSNGNILWSYTKLNDATHMTYSLPASPAVVDTDNDGFIDTAYIGDLGGNIWRFKFCMGADGNTCGTSNWSGGQLFQSATATPIYTTPSVSRGSDATIWIFWGTGDKENPTAAGTLDRFFAVKDPDPRTSTYTLSQLVNITNSIFSGAGSGWYLSLSSGEKVLADSSVFGGMITWTTYTPYTGSDPCQRAGTPKLYALAMMPVFIGGVTYKAGAGLFATSTGDAVGTRSIALGTGIAQKPVFSQKPIGSGATDVFVTTSGGADQSSSIVTSAGLADSPFKSRLQMTAPSPQILYWWDQRVQ